MRFLRYFQLTVFIMVLALSRIAMAGNSMETQLDSLDYKLQVCIDNGAPLTERLHILRKMYDITKITNDQLSLEYAGQAIGMMTEEADESMMAEWLEALADVYYERKIYYMAMERYHDAYVNFMSHGDIIRAAYAIMSVGDTYFIQNLEEVAMQNFQKAEGMFRSAGCQEGRAEALSKIGRVELRNYQYDTAMAIFGQSLKLAEQINNPILMAKAYCYIAEVYDMNDEFEQEEEFLNQAVVKYRIAGEKYEMARIYFQLGDMHFKNEDFQKAYSNYMSASNIFQSFGTIEGIASVISRLGRISFIKGDYKTAELLGRKSLSMAQENLWLAEEVDALRLISDIYKKQGRVDSAYKYLSLYTDANERLYQARKSESFSELQVSLSIQGKEAELATAEQALRRSKTIYTFIVVFSVLVALFLVYVIWNFRKAKRMNAMLSKTNEEVSQKNAEIEAINESINSSINYAGRIQRAMLPHVDFIKKHFPDGFVYFHPKEVVSGDFFWFSEVKSQKPPSLFRRKGNDDEEMGKLILAVIDCTGHGVPGAFMSMLGDAFLNQIVNLQKIVDPALILGELHNLVRTTLQQETTENNDGMDGAVVVVDKSTHTLQYAGAKNPLIVIQDGKVEKVNGDLNSIGGIQKEDKRTFTCHEIDITTPTTIYIYSDGYQDQFGGDHGRKLMAKRFRDMLVENSELPFEEQNELLYKRFSEWRGDIIQMDDTTIIGVKVS